MTNQNLPPKPINPAPARAHPVTVKNLLLWLVKPIASLKLTVALFVASIFIIFVGTLAQVDKDIWVVMQDYFRTWFARIELQVFFPRTWFPKWQNIEGWFPFPGGKTIGFFLFANLIAAHLMRFKVQAKGVRLLAGLAITALGVFVTWFIIHRGHNPDGFQVQPFLEYDVIWLIIKAAIAVVFLAVLAVFVLMLKSDKWRWRAEMWMAGIGALLSGAVTAYFLGPGRSFSLDESSMRILWQLIQGSVAGLVLLAGCVLAFKKRGGIVLIHAGVGLLMGYEFYVSMSAVEQRISIEEKQTVNFAYDTRSLELAIVDPSPADYDQVVVIPVTVNNKETHFVSGGPVRHKDLPFDIEFLHYYPNAELVGVKPDDDNPATKGEGVRTIAKSIRPSGGADAGGEIDMAAGYVRLTQKDGASVGRGSNLGVYLVGTLLSLLDRVETVHVDGKRYHIALRFQREYKPYSMRLIDVRKDDYLGTDTPRNYSSDVQLADPSRHVDRRIRIWMNNPLRFAGETFYQSNYQKDERTGVETTTLQVVTNRGWMAPYVACMLVAVGMFAHFFSTLARFLTRLTSSGEQRISAVEGAIAAEILDVAPERQVQSPSQIGAHGSRTRQGKPARQALQPRSDDIYGRVRVSSKHRAVRMASVILPVLMGLLCAGYFARKAMPKREATEQFSLQGFAQLPVAYEGRVKPFDTLARTTLRIISSKDTYEDIQDDEKHPAIEWLLKVISRTEDADKQRVFRIENERLLDTLGLRRRKGYRYSYQEISEGLNEFRKQVDLARKKPKHELDFVEKKVLDLDRKIQLYHAVQLSHQTPLSHVNDSERRASMLVQMVELSKRLRASGVPYATPYSSGDKAWESLAEASTRIWIRDLAQQAAASLNRQAATLKSEDLATFLAKGITDQFDVDKLAHDRLTAMFANVLPQRATSADVIASLERFVKQQTPNIGQKEAEEKANKLYQELKEAQRQEVLQGIQAIPNNLQAAIDSVITEGSLADAPNPAADSLVRILDAYRTGNVAVFNRQVKKYADMIQKDQPQDYRPAKTGFEAFFNRFDPFYWCKAWYLIAFLFVLAAWLAILIGWFKPLNNAALAIIAVTFLVHTLALIGRIYIHGRPPVTNLYSSAIFIGWALAVFGIVLELFFRIGVGNALAAVLGFATLLIAPYVGGDGDTFTVLQAVLDTNFWLATHVVCITLGYAATYAGAFLGVVFIIAGVFTPALGLRIVRRILASMTYGAICFAIFFSFVGTVLGGLWADDSWGRFWGWDPKENGALIIVLWNAVVLHARWGGMIKERGLAVLTIIGSIVTSWSWFGVNELGVGLHSYGFTEGVLLTLAWVLLGHLVLIVIGLIPKQFWWSYAEEKRAAGGQT